MVSAFDYWKGVMCVLCFNISLFPVFSMFHLLQYFLCSCISCFLHFLYPVFVRSRIQMLSNNADSEVLSHVCTCSVQIVLYLPARAYP